MVLQSRLQINNSQCNDYVENCMPKGSHECQVNAESSTCCLCHLPQAQARPHVRKKINQKIMKYMFLQTLASTPFLPAAAASSV
jgi:hypothetical protein